MCRCCRFDQQDVQVDIHALRHTFGTHLARAGVAPRTAMAAMRHSKIELTMNVYTDPALLDIAGAVDSLPAF
ncbi:MAG: tyrosine-type recombinase/integrase [Phycisphaerae bacterium]|nr:tyrosine-type recombinase/integrase [Phycisphaerae bacterium]